ncbi:hypothetical protein BDZ89DRAFT_1069304 [Hymenopellis radicata]|nr:hypothetical protein BDZ89DRAFT_1069304 [Hymenopellis radicata]
MTSFLRFYTPHLFPDSKKTSRRRPSVVSMAAEPMSGRSLSNDSNSKSTTSDVPSYMHRGIILIGPPNQDSCAEAGPPQSPTNDDQPPSPSPSKASPTPLSESENWSRVEQRRLEADQARLKEVLDRRDEKLKSAINKGLDRRMEELKLDINNGLDRRMEELKSDIDKGLDRRMEKLKSDIDKGLDQRMDDLKNTMVELLKDVKA